MMHLVTTADVDDLKAQIEVQHGFRIATLDVSFDTFDFARTGANLVDRAVAYSTPSGDRIAGLGTAWRATAKGGDRFNTLRRALADLNHPDLTAFVGFSFLPDGPTSATWDGYEAAEVFIPRISLQKTDVGTRLTVVIPPGDAPDATLDLLGSMRRPKWVSVEDTGDHSIESHPHVSEWASAVATAIDAIRSGSLEKVVLARSVTVSSTEPVQILRVFRSLISRYPLCYNFAWKSGDAVFLGASPELLADVRGRRLLSNPLAGSAKRGIGDEDDRRIGDALLSSAKDREEHRLVVEDLRMRLGSLVSDLEVQDMPTLKKMATVQHLSTELSAKLLPGYGVLDAVSAAHPTPAVGGVSRDDAVAFISRAEQIDRGWYTGGVGWINGRGEGSICIGLRCGLVRGLTTHLFAGAGIVADSQPDAEVAETRLKLRPMLDLLATS
ncbi:MAG: isochorismate synthase [Acidimicrobiia bacterium]|nr:MAG: isochorismate synthase [Acidimicrobiia bacterium]